MPKRIRSSAVTITLLATTVLVTFMAPRSQAEEATPVQRLEVGQTAPDFTLPDPDGTDHTASALRGEKNLLVVFFRGAW